MKIANKKYYQQYYDLIGHQLKSLIDNFDFGDSRINLGYVTQASAVYSSNIEGNSIDLNSFMGYKLSQDKIKQ